MPKLIIGTTVINFPATGSDAVWSQAVDDFAVAVTNQLSGLASAFDISPRVQVLTNDGYTGAGALPISGCIFPNVSVRSFNFSYAIYRTNSVTSLDEVGTVNGIYNMANAVWNLEHNFSGLRQSDGSLYHSFSMSGDQLVVEITALGGAYDGINSKISYSAKTLLINNP